MTDTKISRPRGRPRRFDPDQALPTAQKLFWTHGYDAVSLTDLTHALGINPPSFYSAFGNKAGLFSQILQRYGETKGIPLKTLLRSDRPVAACLADVLETAAHLYAASSEGAGCLALEGLNSGEPEVREMALAVNLAAEELVRSYIAERHPDDAGRITDFIGTTLIGMSTKARNGHDLERLLASARLASVAIAQAIPA